MLFRIALVTTVLVGGMVAVKDGRMLDRAGLVGSCTAVATPDGHDGVWHACRPGKLEGRPNLARKSCVSVGFARELEYWQCRAPIGTGPPA
jgi:hypothetical protein